MVSPCERPFTPPLGSFGASVVRLLMSVENISLHLSGCVTRVSNPLFSEIENTHLEGQIETNEQLKNYSLSSQSILVILRSLPNHLKHWHQLYLRRCSNTPQKCPRFPGNCGPGLPSETTVSTAPERILIGHPAASSILVRLVCLPWCSKCEHTYQRSRWPGASHRG